MPTDKLLGTVTWKLTSHTPVGHCWIGRVLGQTSESFKVLRRTRKSVFFKYEISPL